MAQGEDARPEPLTKERAEALALALASSVGTMTQMWERQMSTLLALVAVVAALPETASVDPKKVGATIHLMAAKQRDPERIRDEMTTAASFLINLSRRLRDAEVFRRPETEGDQVEGHRAEPRADEPR